MIKEEEHPFGLGVKFCPDDVECLLYLTCKIVGDPLPCDDVILDCLNPYDDTQLPALFLAAENRDLFFFTKLRRKGTRTGSSKNADRTVANNKATWHGLQSWDVTYSCFGVIGTAHTFTYRENGSTNDRRFLITEYHLPQNTSLRYDPLIHHVLCRLRINNGNRNHGSSHQAGPSTKKRKYSDHHAGNQAASTSLSTFHHQFPTPPAADVNWTTPPDYPSSSTPHSSYIYQYSCEPPISVFPATEFQVQSPTPPAADANWTTPPAYPSSSTPDSSYMYQYSCEPPISVFPLAMATEFQVQSLTPPAADTNWTTPPDYPSSSTPDSSYRYQYSCEPAISVFPSAIATEFQVQSPADAAAAAAYNNQYDCLFKMTQLDAGQDQECQPAALLPSYCDQVADLDEFDMLANLPLLQIH